MVSWGFNSPNLIQFDMGRVAEWPKADVLAQAKLV